MELGPYQIKLRFIFIMLLLVFLLVVGISMVLDREAADERPGDLGPFSYPFEPGEREEFEEGVISEVMSGQPLHAQYPEALGARLRFRVYLPEGATSRNNDFVFTQDGFIYYPSVIVPADVRGLGAIIDAFEGPNSDIAISWLENYPVMLGFREADTPPDSAQFLEILGTYYWSNERLDANKPAGIPTSPAVLVGDYEVLQEPQVVDPATATVPVDFSVRRGPLTINLTQVEFTPSGTRVRVHIINDSTNDIDWDYSSPQTFLTADDRQYRLDLEEIDSDDSISRVIPPRQSDGFLFFDRTGIPSSMEIYLVEPINNSVLRHTIDMRRVEERVEGNTL